MNGYFKEEIFKRALYLEAAARADLIRSIIRKREIRASERTPEFQAMIKRLTEK